MGDGMKNMAHSTIYKYNVFFWAKLIFLVYLFSRKDLYNFFKAQTNKNSKPMFNLRVMVRIGIAGHPPCPDAANGLHHNKTNNDLKA